jgi:Tfp pilus assembly protein PilN
MIDLNFLPAQEQKTIKGSLAFLLTRNVLIWLLIMSLVLVLLLMSGRIFLANNLASVQEQSILVSGVKLSFSDQIDALNKTLEEVEDIQAEHIEWSLVLTEIATLVPEGNEVDQITLSSKNKNFTMNGFSQTREDILALEAAMKNSSLITNLESPLSNLLEPVEINFKFSGDLIFESQE